LEKLETVAEMKNTIK